MKWPAIFKLKMLHLLTGILVFFCFVSIPAAVASESTNSIQLSDGFGKIKVGRYMDYYTGPSGDTDFNSLQPSTRAWKTSSHDNINFGFTEKAYWLRFTTSNLSDADIPWFLEIPYPAIDLVKLYYHDASGKLRKMEAGDRIPFSRRPIPDRHLVFPIVQPPGEMILYLKVQTTSSLNFTPVIWDYISFIRGSNSVLSFCWFYYGLLVAMGVYNFFLFLSIREKSYLYYVLFISSFAILQFTLNGFSFQYLWPNAIWWANNCLPFMISTTLFLGWMFARYYAATPWQFPVMDRFMTGLVGMPTMLFIPMTLSGHYALSIKVAIGLAVYFTVATFVFCIYAAMKGSKQAKQFALSFTFMVMGVTLYALKSFGVLPSVLITEWAIQVGSAFIVLVLSLGLADRINRLEENLSTSNENLSIFKQFAEESAQGLVMVDLEDNITYANSGFLKMVHAPDGFVVTGTPSRQFYPEDQNHKRFKIVGPVIRNQGKWIGEMRLKAMDGNEIPVIQSFFLVRDNQGKSTYFASVITDITENKRAEAELERRVRERTAAMLKVNDKLSREVTQRRQIEGSLRNSQKRYQALFQNNPIATIIVDQNACITQFNLATRTPDNRTPGIGDTMFVNFPGPVDARLQTSLITSIRSGTSVEYPDQKYQDMFYHIRVTPFFEGAIITLIDITDVKKAEQHIHTLTHELIKVQEVERQRIARDLHDNVAQDLASLTITAQTLFDASELNPPGMQAHRDQFSNILKESIRKIRDLSYDLQPPILDQLGLVQALFRYCEEFSEAHHIPVDFHAAGVDQLTLDFDSEINLYRIVQEGLNNIRKHANSSSVNVRFVYAHPNLLLRIEDNGNGFDITTRLYQAVDERRMGIRSIQERASLLGGRFKIDSKQDIGTRLVIEIPAARYVEAHHAAS